MRLKYLTLAAIIALGSVMLPSCSEEFGPGVKESTIERVEGYKLIKFMSDKVEWPVSAGENGLKVLMHAHGSDELFRVELTVEHSDGKRAYTLRVPETQSIPDGCFDAIVIDKSGTYLGPRHLLEFKNEIVQSVGTKSGAFRLRGKGTAENPYIIASKSDFEEFELGLCNDEASKGFGLFFDQTADFDVPPRSQIIMGTYHACESFAGNYNGNDHTITVPYVGGESDADKAIGLFKELSNGAVIKNLCVNAMIQGVASEGGGLAGISNGEVTIDNVTVTGAINNDNRYNIGGMIGSGSGNLTISNCRINVYVKGEDAVGGLIGRFDDGTLTIKNISNRQDDNSFYPFSVAATAANAGGLIGRINGAANISVDGVELNRSVQAEDVNVKAVSVKNENAGGLIGGIFAMNSCAIGNASVNAPVYGGNSTGGLIGYVNLSSDISLENVSFHSVASGNENVGGIFGTVHGNKNNIIIGGNDKSTSVKQESNALVAIKGVKSVGGFAGYLQETTVKGAVAYLNTQVTASQMNAGGACGRINDVTLDATRFSSSNSMHVYAPENAGGLIGYAYGSTVKGNVSISNLSGLGYIPDADTFESSFSGTVSTTDNYGKSIGGCIGYAKDTNIEGLCFSGTVIGANNVGGIVGLAEIESKGGISSCVNRSQKITNSLADNTGGIVGMVEPRPGIRFENLINYAEIAGSDHTGGIAGYINCDHVSDNMRLSNALNLGKISGTYQVGGCVGYIYARESNSSAKIIEYSANYGEISNSSGGNIGGVAGYFNARHSHLLRSANYGRVSGSGNDVKVGGLAGRMGTNDGPGSAEQYNLELAYCCNFGEIRSDTRNANVGGILGWQEQGAPTDPTHYMLHDCYNMGILPTDHDKDTGGILGCIDHQGEIQRCINVGQVSHGNGCVGTHKDGCIYYHHDLYYRIDSGKGWDAESFKDNEKKNQSKFKNFDFNEVWAIDNDDSHNDGYPYLRDCPWQSVKIKK